MPVPSTLADLNTTAASNYPTGGESVGSNLDDYLRAHAAFIAQVHEGATTVPSGIVKSSGTALSAASAGTDYLAPAAIGVTVQAYDADIPTVSASQAEMEAGTETALRSMSPLRVAQAIAAQASPITSVGNQASTSGTSIDFSGIPSLAKRITISGVGVSTNGTSPLAVRLGTSGGFELSGYQSVVGNRISEQQSTTHLLANNSMSASLTCDFVMYLILQNTSTNTWSAFGTANLNNASIHFECGSKSLSGELTQVRVTTLNGTDTFDAGSIDVIYE